MTAKVKRRTFITLLGGASVIARGPRSRLSAHREPPAYSLRRASDGLACAHLGDRVDSPFVGGLPVQPTVGPLLCKANVKAD